MGKHKRGSGRPPQPKGRPTVGRKQRMAAARARARRRRLIIRLYWVAGIALLVGLLAVLIVTGIGAGPGPGVR